MARPWKRRAPIAVGVIVGALCLCICCIAAVPLRDMAANNLQLRRYERAFGNLGHPSATTVIASRSAVGLLSGNSNHCDFFVGEMRRYSGDPHRVLAYYAHRQVANHTVSVAFVTGGELAEPGLWFLPQNLRHPAQWLGHPAGASDQLYIVLVLDVGHDPGWDLRCS